MTTSDPAPPTRPHLLAGYTALLCVTALVLGALTATVPATDSLVLLAALIASVVVLDLVEVDLFGRGNFSPATTPTIALAAAFGPAGPLLGEAVAGAVRVRHATLVPWALDLGALSLCGIAAAWASAAVPAGGAWIVVGCLAAAVVYYLANCVLLGIAWMLNEGISPVAAWRERLAWAAPHYLAYGVMAGVLLLAYRSFGLALLAIAGLPLAVLWLGQKQYLDRSRQGVEELRESHAKLASANRRLTALVADKQELLDQLREASVATVQALARTIEAKDPYTGGHTERVADYAVALARQLGFDADDLAAVAIGGVIHDVGKVGVRDHVLQKPGKLDADEWQEMRRHTEMSSYILDGLAVPQIAKDIARHHHERFDGGGYPDRLAGDEIPLAARILSVADTLDAMTTTRPYRAALSFDEALAEIRRNVDTQFCPRVVHALESSLRTEPAAWATARDQFGSPQLQAA